MQNEQIAFVTPTDAPSWQRWLVLSPAARIIFFAAMLIGFSMVTRAAVVALGWTVKTADPLHHALATLSLQLLPALLGYAILVVGVLYLAGSYHVIGTDPQVDWLPGVLVAGIGAGISEEIITRGVIFRVVEEGLGTWWALVISALFFGGAHIFNPGATLWSSAAIAIEAGLLLAMIYHVTRSLWACIGLHAGWNIMQGTVYGIPVSGGASKGWLISSRTGPDWLSGGVFGAEASVVALLACSLVTLALLMVALRRESIVAPAWSR